MNDMRTVFAQWGIDISRVREQMYRAPTPRERERWHVIWLVEQGWSVIQVAAALERDERTIDSWLKEFKELGPTALGFEQSGGSAPPSIRRSKSN